MNDFKSAHFDGSAFTIKKFFSRTTSVAILINASKKTVWNISTEADGYTTWNTTIISLEGTIEENSTILLKTTLDPKKPFKLKVKELEPNHQMVWQGMMGKRTFHLETFEGKTLFKMSETIGGPFFPLFSSKIPSFDNAFEEFAQCLKVFCEKIENR